MTRWDFIKGTDVPYYQFEGLQSLANLHAALNRALNTWPEGPPELFAACDELTKLLNELNNPEG